MKTKLTLFSFFSFIMLALSSPSINYSQTALCVEQVSGVTATLTSVHAMTSQQAWVCGYNATVLRTTNGGTNWINVSGNGIPVTRLLVNVAGISTTTALVAGYEGVNTYVYHTSNSGANWTQVFFQASGFINAINMRSGSQGYMQGDPVGARWSLWRTTNGGLNWDSTGLYLPQAASEAGWNNCMVTHNGGTPGPRMWFGTNNSRIYYSTNGGSNWVVQSTAPEINSYALYFPYNPTDDGFMGGATMMKTSNLGMVWSAFPSAGTGNFSGITGTNLFVDNPEFLSQSWYVRTTTQIYYAGGGGSNWVVNHTAPAGNYRHISLTDFSNVGTWYAVRDNGGITKGSYSIGSVEPVSAEIPHNFSLSQNYPNPFNPSTAFKFSIPKSSHVSLKIYNALGAEVETLLDKVLSPSEYEAKWDASRYPSGAYFYTLEADEYRETKKMLLLK